MISYSDMQYHGRQLEKYFRLYLRTRVQEHPYQPIIVNYNAAGIGSLPQKETLKSATKTAGDADAKVFDITILSPHFYVAWAASQSMQTFLSDMASEPEEARLVEVSDPQSFGWFLDNSERDEKVYGDKKYPGRVVTWYLIGQMRKWSFQHLVVKDRSRTTKKEPATIGHCPTKDHRIIDLPDINSRAYEKCVLQAMLMETIGLGHGKVMQGYDLVIRGTLVYLSWCGFLEAGALKPWYTVGGLMAWRILKEAF